MGTALTTTTTTTTVPARYLPWWERGEAWRRQDTPASRERARREGLVWSTRTRQWMTAAALREEDRKAAIVWTDARRVYAALCPVQWR